MIDLTETSNQQLLTSRYAKNVGEVQEFVEERSCCDSMQDRLNRIAKNSGCPNLFRCNCPQFAPQGVSCTGKLLEARRVTVLVSASPYLSYVGAVLAGTRHIEHKSDSATSIQNRNAPDPEVSLTALLPCFPDFIDIMSGGASGSRTSGIAIDDENYPGRLKKWTTAVQAKIDIGFFEGGGKASVSYGSYEEWDTIRKYVTANIADLANTYSVFKNGAPACLGGLQRPDVSVYLSRHHILKQASLKTYWAKLRGTDIFRIDCMGVLQQKYDAQFERISKSFSVLLSILNKKTAPGSKSEIALQNLDIGDGNGLNLSLRANSLNGSGRFGIDTPFLKAGGTYSFDRDSTSLDLIVSTSMCEKMTDIESEVAEKLTLNMIHRDELEVDVSNPFDEIAEKRKRLERLSNIKLEKTNLLQEIRNEIYVKSAGLRRKLDADHSTRTLALGNRREIQKGKSELPWSHLYGAAGIQKPSIEIEVVDLTRKFQSLQRDLQAYITFQSQLSTATTKLERTSAESAIKNFHSMYGANDSIDCMVRMIILNAWLYTALGDLEKCSLNFPDVAMLIKVSKQSIKDFEVGSCQQRCRVKSCCLQ